MADTSYLENIFRSIGVKINSEENQEIIYHFPLVFDEKSLTYNIENSYSITKQPLGTFFTDFLNIDFEIDEDFKKFFVKYPSALLKENFKKIFNKGPISKDDFDNILKKLYCEIKNQLIRIQEQVDEILDYCIINPRNRKVKYSPVDRLLVLQSVHENLTLLKETKMEVVSFYKIPYQKLKDKNEDEIYKILENTKAKKYHTYIPTNIESFINFVLCQIIESKLYLKICKNCGLYFITSNSQVGYCDNISPGANKTCSEIGVLSSFQNTIENDTLIKRYYKLYSKKHVYSKRNPDIQEYVKDFENFKKYGKNKLASYKSKKISAEEFEIWLNKKDK